MGTLRTAVTRGRAPHEAPEWPPLQLIPRLRETRTEVLEKLADAASDRLTYSGRAIRCDDADERERWARRARRATTRAVDLILDARWLARAVSALERAATGDAEALVAVDEASQDRRRRQRKERCSG